MASKRKGGLTRRDFLRTAVAAGAGMGLARIAGATESEGTPSAPPAGAPSMIGVPFEGFRTVRVGIIGVGGRGTGLLGDLLAIPDVQVKAICDIVRDKVLNAQRMVVGSGQPNPEGYWASETDYENLCKRDDLDLIYIATPWDWHVPMAVSGMLNGKHVGVEVPAATTVKDCWKLVDTSEKTRKHCVMLENVCYGYSEMMVLNMVRSGVFGELTHGEAAYIHDLRGLLFSGGGEALWRREGRIQLKRAQSSAVEAEGRGSPSLAGPSTAATAGDEFAARAHACPAPINRPQRRRSAAGPDGRARRAATTP